MSFAKTKNRLYPPEKGMALNTFITALLVAACFFVPYIITDRGYFLFFGDFNVQQIPFYQLAHDAVRNGEWGWSFTTDLGANFIGSYTFYLLTSPFFWLTIPFPNSFVPHLMGPLLILKFGCAALTAYLYIRRFTKNTMTAQLGAMLYAFSGFSVYNVFFNHFHEAIIFFPLLLLSFEYLFAENRPGFFALMVAVCAVVNYFFFVGMLVFGIIYMVIRLISHTVKPSVRLVLTVVFEALLGIALASFVLLPSYLAIANAERVGSTTLGWNSLLFGKESIYANVIEIFFFPPDLPARPVMFPKSDVKWSSLGAWMPVFSMVGVFAWVRAKRGSWQKRIIITSAVMALVPILNSSFYLFNDAYYARWFYMPILIMCLVTAMALEDSDIKWKKPFIEVSAITLLFTLVIGFFPQKKSDQKLSEAVFGLFTDPKNEMYRFRFSVTVSIAIIGLVLLGIILYIRKRGIKNWLQTAVITVSLVSLVYANFFIAWGKQHSYDDTQMIDNLIESELELMGDKSTYRIDVNEGIDNTAMFLGYSSINCFHSIVPASVTEFYDFIGEDRGVASRPTAEVFPIRSFLSVKYLIDMADRDNDKYFFNPETEKYKMPGFHYVDQSEGYLIYENENYIPYGFSYESYMTEEDVKALAHSDSERAKLLLKAMLLSKEQVKKYGYMFTNINETQIYYSNSAMSEDCKKLAESSAISFEQGKNSFKATVQRDKGTLVFFSIPYDEGWTAYVNGQKAEIERVNVGFMAVAVGEGESTIEFKYETPGLKTGLLVSGGAVVVFIVYLLISRRFKGKAPLYYEGEELLALWESQTGEAALSDKTDIIE